MKKLLIFIAFLILPILSAMAKEGMSLEQIAKISAVGEVEISPNGSWIAFTKSKPRVPYKDEDGTAWRELYLISTSDKNAEPKPFITGKVSIGRISWSKNSQKIYYSAKRHDDKKSALYAIPVDGGESQQLATFVNGIGGYSFNHDESKLIFTGKPKAAKHIEKLKKKGFKAKVYEEDIRLNKLWLVDFSEKAKAESENKDYKPQAIDIEQNVVSAKFSPVNDEILVQLSPTSLIDDIYMKKSLQIIDLKGKVKTKFKTEGKQDKAGWSTDGQQVAFLGANDYNDPTAGALYIGNAKTGDVSKRKDNKDSHVRDFVWQGDDIYFIEQKDAESQIIRAPVKRRIADTPVVPYGQAIHNSLSVASNGQLAINANTATHPNEVFLAAQRLTNSNPWLDNLSLGKQEVFNYQAKDGLSLQGVLVYPINYKKGQRYPMIAFVHGGPEAHRSNGWNTRYADPIQVAAANGYVSFIPNYRGSTGRGDTFARADQHAYADPEFSDIVDGKDALVAKGLVNAKKVGITGGSYGGFATAWSATALSEHYAAGVMFVGISNQLSKFGTTDIPNEMHAVHARAWPWDDYQWMLERSPIFHVKKAKTPLLIMHGENDTRVHPSQSMEMYRYLKTLGQAPVRLVLYPGEGHGNRKAAAQLDYSLRLMRWMDHYLKGKGGKPPKYDLEHEKKLEKKKD